MGTGIGGTTATITKQLETPTIHEKKVNKMAASLLPSEVHSRRPVWLGLVWLERKLIGWPVFEGKTCEGSLRLTGIHR